MSRVSSLNCDHLNNSEVIKLFVQSTSIYVHACIISLQHDDGKECAPYLTFTEEPDDGFYLMHSVASPIRKKNNRVFSNCSNEFVARILTDEHYVECFEGTREYKKLSDCFLIGWLYILQEMFAFLLNVCTNQKYF